LKLRAAKFSLLIGLTFFGLAQALTIDDFNRAAVVAIQKIPWYSGTVISASVQLKSYQRNYFEQMTENVRVVCATPELREMSRMMMLRVTLRDEARVREQLRLKFTVSVERPAYYTKTVLLKNTVVKPDELYLQTANILAYAQALVGPETDLTGMYSIQEIPPDRPLFAWMIATKPLITTGETVSVTFYTEGIQLKMPGTALQDGRIGDKIRIQLNKTKKVFKVTIVDRDRYEVRL
jgi:flagella basal body P-ring formation protein FlgA